MVVSHWHQSSHLPYASEVISIVPPTIPSELTLSREEALELSGTTGFWSSPWAPKGNCSREETNMAITQAVAHQPREKTPQCRRVLAFPDHFTQTFHTHRPCVDVSKDLFWKLMTKCEFREKIRRGHPVVAYQSSGTPPCFFKHLVGPCWRVVLGPLPCCPAMWRAKGREVASSAEAVCRSSLGWPSRLCVLLPGLLGHGSRTTSRPSPVKEEFHSRTPQNGTR